MLAGEVVEKLHGVVGRGYAGLYFTEYIMKFSKKGNKLFLKFKKGQRAHRLLFPIPFSTCGSLALWCVASVLSRS